MFTDRVEVQDQGRRGKRLLEGCFPLCFSSSLYRVSHYSHFLPHPFPHSFRKKTHSHRGQHLSQERTPTSGLRRPPAPPPPRSSRMSRRRSTGDLVPRDISEILAREARAQRGQKKSGGSLGQAFGWLKGNRKKKGVSNGLRHMGVGVMDAKVGFQNHEHAKGG